MANDIASAVAFHRARRAGAVLVVLQATASALEVADAATRLGVRFAVAPEEQVEAFGLAGPSAISWIPAAQLQILTGSRRDPSECCVRGAHLLFDDFDDEAAFEDGWFSTMDSR